MPGVAAFSFMRRPSEAELLRCYRKAFVIYLAGSNSVVGEVFIYGSETYLVLPVTLPVPIGARPSFQGGGYDNLASDTTNAGCVSSVALLNGPVDYATSRNAALKLSVTTALSTAGYGCRLYTQSTALAHPTRLMFED
ncbi:hypothetical protein R75461_08363 [Paraburkholderia nemoris]|nr:hypothetical protein [Paraburkholderia aspalathi]MBK3787135.1 hypothetical protein [Paraburkholderia aspalathi]CAE6867377.1 hypothetical protein R75461_08363 [Paraburkholderia nemoris]